MKMFYFISFTFLMISCRKDAERINPDKINATITINGNNYSFNHKQTSIGRYTLPLFGTEYISIRGWVNLYSNLQITLPPQIILGTYTDDYSATFFDKSTETYYHSNDSSGTVTITDYNGISIKGTFQFSCFSGAGQEAKITNGTFEGDL